jgi:hypothetical protein
VRSILVATSGAFAGGVLVVAFQTIFALISARYPPIVQGMHCNFAKPSAQEGAAPDASVGDDLAAAAPGDASAGKLVPTVSTEDDIECRVDAPGADYVAWALSGKRLEFRSGPLDPNLPCQDGDAFSEQSPDHLRISSCQRFHVPDPGLQTLIVKVMARGVASVDRAALSFIAQRPPPIPTPPPEPPIETRLRATLLIPERTQQQERRLPVSESLSEHGLLPTSRDFSRTVYRLTPDETYVSSNFLATSAAYASGTRVTYQSASRSVVISFTLRSGPFVDRWRGWLSGTVVVRVRSASKGRDVELPDIALRLPGRSEVALPEDVAADNFTEATLRLVRSETKTTIDTKLGVPALLDDVEITSRIEDGKLIVDAKPKG